MMQRLTHFFFFLQIPIQKTDIEYIRARSFVFDKSFQCICSKGNHFWQKSNKKLKSLLKT